MFEPNPIQPMSDPTHGHLFSAAAAAAATTTTTTTADDTVE